MQEIATITTIHAESGEEAVAVIRAAKNLISVCLSLMHDGDVEVVFKLEDGRSLLEALHKAIAIAENSL
ncbi:MAG: hypothetical protein ACREBG_01140 [Pyrinomonadaceae bacterium]